MNERQQEEIKTIKGRKLTLNLSDADCKKVSALCGAHGITVGKLLENFIGDLVGGTYSNGSDERAFAKQWFERCWFGFMPPVSLSEFLIGQFISVEDFFSLIDDIKEGEETLVDWENNPDKYDAEEIEFLKTDMEGWKQELGEYKTRFEKVKPEADWDKELESAREWYNESVSLLAE